MASSSQQDQDNITPEQEIKNKKGFKYYIPLYKAALQGDWKEAKMFFEKDPDAVVARISSISMTALHVSVMSGHIFFVEEMVKLMPKDALALRDFDGNTALHSAAAAGNTELAKVMVEKNPDLTQMRGNSGKTPIIRAATLGHKDLLWYLCSVTRDEDPNSPFRGENGVELLKTIIAANLYDVALYLIKLYPHLATTTDNWNQSALHALAKRTSAFKSGSGLGFWQLCIYSCIHVEQTSITNYHRRGDMENPPVSSREDTNMTKINRVLQRLNGEFWDAIKQLVPSIKKIYDTKVMNTQALELLKCFGTQVSLLNTHEEICSLLDETTMLAAEYGNVEVLSACIEIDPEVSLVKNNETNNNILHVAIMYRHEKVFNLIRKMGPSNIYLTGRTNNEQNTILHQAAKLGPVSKLNVVSGAALQVQRELQWYQEVEKLVQPTYREKANNSGEKPRILFTETHRELIEKGEKWMKDMASSSMVVATLIATVIFAAAFTVPGGNNNGGTPNFLEDKRFTIFAISNAMALFSSLTSVLIFLSILTSRYAEEDFLRSLPQKLIIGLAMLFFSIAAMMVTFSATCFIMLGQRLAALALILALLACFPVTLFALLQLPLFVEIIRSTYGSDVFNR